MSDAGLVPLFGLAEQTGLAEIIADKVSIKTSRIKSGAANPAPKLVDVIAGMCAGADSIDDLDVLRAGGMPILFDGVYAPSTFGTLLREFRFGHARQLESVLREHLAALAERTELRVGIDEQVFIDIDSLLRPVYGHAKQGAAYGHTKIAGKQVLRKGHSPLATTISTERCAPVIAGMRLPAGKTGSGKGAGRMVARAIVTARAADTTGQILVRGDSAYGNRAVVRACRRGNAEFSLVMTMNRAIARAIATIPDTAWTPVRYPGAVQDPETGAWISDAEVAEVPYTAFAANTDRMTARLVVRRVKYDSRVTELGSNPLRLRAMLIEPASPGRSPGARPRGAAHARRAGTPQNRAGAGGLAGDRAGRRPAAPRRDPWPATRGYRGSTMRSRLRCCSTSSRRICGICGPRCGRRRCAVRGCCWARPCHREARARRPHRHRPVVGPDPRRGHRRVRGQRCDLGRGRLGSRRGRRSGPCSRQGAARPLSSANVSGGGLSAPSGPVVAILARNSVSPACES